jgi:SAM-dependent methyltransferase
MKGAPRCKCCAGPTDFFGSVDTARSCEDRRGEPVFAATGHMVTYWQCRSCGFLFTPDFDALSNDDLAARIYNGEYVRADPDFVERRPQFFSTMLSRSLATLRGSLTALDFGGGQGLLARLMRAQGFRFDSVDPHFDRDADQRRHGPYDLVTAFEVVEHSRTPIATFRAALAALKPGGTLLFSTLLVPRRADMGWWYLAPRNGHVSLHTDRSLAACARACAMQVLSLEAGLHLFISARPNAAAHALVSNQLDAALYAASRRGAWALLNTARSALRFGPAGRAAVLSLRHPVRAGLVEAGLIR